MKVGHIHGDPITILIVAYAGMAQTINMFYSRGHVGSPDDLPLPPFEQVIIADSLNIFECYEDSGAKDWQVPVAFVKPPWIYVIVGNRELGYSTLISTLTNTLMGIELSSSTQKA